MKIAKRINLKKQINLGNGSYTVLEYLRDTEYPAELISIMADESCDIRKALEIYKERQNVRG